MSFTQLGTQLGALAGALALAACVGAAVEAPTPESDAARGLVIAQEWCAVCHAVAPDQATPAGSSAPAFAAIAADPAKDRTFLSRFMSEVHLPMPTFRLLPDEKEHVIAHILSLSPQAPGDDRGGAAAPLPVPDFAALMRAPWRDRFAVDRFLRSIAESEPHGAMPGFWLDPAERQQLTAYLASLRPDAVTVDEGAAGGRVLAQAWCQDCHGPPPLPGAR